MGPVAVSGSKISRGHPLVALLAVLGGWAGGRAATWDASPANALQVPTLSAAAAESTGYAVDPRGGPLSFPDTGPAYAYPSMPIDPRGGAGGYFRYPAAMPETLPGRGWAGRSPYYADAPGPSYPSIPRHLRDDFALSEPLPRFYAPEPPRMAAMRPPSAAPQPASQRPRRWSADAWALIRRDSAGGVASPGAFPATYGASQAGAVLRYRLALSSRYRPAVYMRTTSTMGLPQETAAAIGLSARPVPSFPVIAGIEARLTDQAGRHRFQPAILAVTELPPLRLPAGFRGEAYAQGGYVAGSFATPFADGQFRADRALLSVGKVDTRIGAGIWGGVQKGAARLDAGPSASVAMPLGRGTNGRIAIDWRFRLAGEAVPDSGPALTLSAGF